MMNALNKAAFVGYHGGSIDYSIHPLKIIHPLVTTPNADEEAF